MSPAGAAGKLGRLFAAACLLAFGAACDPACDRRDGQGAAREGAAAASANSAQDGTPLGAGPAGRASDGARLGDVQDDRGRRLAGGTPRRRIVSLVPAATETLVAIGATDRLAARTDYDVQPELAHLPSVGGGLDPSLEFLVQLDPDLVVAWAGADGARATETRMDDLGVDTYGAAPQTLADFRRLAANLGRLLGLEPKADSLVAVVARQLAQARAVWAGKAPVTAMYVVSRAPAITTGGGTFLDSVMAAAGAVNVFADAGGGWPRISLEEVVSRDPRYLLVPVSGDDAARAIRGRAPPGAEPDEAAALAARLAEETGWAEAPAVAAGRIVAVDAGLFGRPGPRMGEAALRLARLLHGAPRR